MSYQSILKAIPAIQAAALAVDTAKLSKKKNLKVDDMIHSSTKILVGSSLIKTEAQLINLL